MRILYKLPQFLAIIALIGIGIEIYPYVKLDGATNILLQVKYQAIVENTLMTSTGIDLYTILNNTAWLFVFVLAVLRRDLIKVKVWMAIVVVLALWLQITYGGMAIRGIEGHLSDTSLSVITMTGQYVYGTVPLTLLLAFVLSKILKKSIWKLLDFIAPLWLTDLVFVRLACFTAGCCGIEACSIIGIEMVLPAQLLEVMVNLILLQLVFNSERKRVAGENTHIKEGSDFFIAVGGHATFRLLIDFMRDVPNIFLGMTFAQIYSLVCVVVSIIVLVKLKDKSIGEGT